MIIVLQIIAVLCAVLSSAFFVFTYRGWMRALRKPPVRIELRPVSVIVAAHNECGTLPKLLDALEAQDYPRELLEIIIVDDRSNDGTADSTLRYSESLPLSILRIDAVPDGVSPKKHALHAGIMAASHELLLFTDADCIPRSSWIRGMVSAFAEGIDAVIGLAPLSAGKGGASAYAAFESRRTATLAVAAAASGFPYMASGRSWAFSRTMYEKCGGLPSIYAHLGGDDDLLLQQMLRHGASVGVCVQQDAIVVSPALETWRDLFRQKLRHYRVSAAYRGRAAILLALFVISEGLTPLAVIALTIFIQGPERVIPLILWFWKLWYDVGFLQHAFRWNESKAGRFRLAFWEGFHIFFSTLTGFTSFVKPPRW
ncbi:MAG: glycosyltransferase [Bacteroidota bacterium]